LLYTEVSVTLKTFERPFVNDPFPTTNKVFGFTALNLPAANIDSQSATVPCPQLNENLPAAKDDPDACE